MVAHTDDIRTLTRVLLILTLVTVAQFVLTLYVKHNEIFKNDTLAEQITWSDLDKKIQYFFFFSLICIQRNSL